MDRQTVNLKQMYEMKMTPQRKVEAFRRFVIKLKQQKYYGRNLSSQDYLQADMTLFREEAMYMKGLDVEYDMQIRLTREIRCLEEMTDEQILCYYTLVKRFRRNVMERASMTYARYYMLEVVNLIYEETPEEAYDTLFSFWDALNGKKKVSSECTEYFFHICQLFMLAHQELLPKMTEELERRSGMDWSGRTLEKISLGDYRCAAVFVARYARLLKKEEIWSDAEDVRHTREALPYVFERLEERLSDYDFRNMLLNGFYGSMYLGDYPVRNEEENRKQTVSLSGYRYYEYQEYSDYWKFWYFVLRESVQDLLNVIRQHTQSCIRNLLKLKAGKSTAVRMLKKSYMGKAERPEDVIRLKEMVSDERFAAAVQEGVLLYLEEQKIPIPDRKKRKPRKDRTDIDYGETVPDAAIDREKLKKAREDADLILDMLKEGELAYEDTVMQETKQSAAAIGKGDGLAAAKWQKEELIYLQFLRDGSPGAASDYLETLQMPENVMIRQINEKALEIMGDILLERTDGTVCIPEDYEKEADRILGDRQ